MLAPEPALFPALAHVGRYALIYADPPWSYQNFGMAKHGAARAHYQGMTVEELCALPVCELAAADCALALWCTSPMGAEGIHATVMRAWGFRPVTKLFSWRKVYDLCRCGHAPEQHRTTVDPHGKPLVTLCRGRRCSCTRLDRRPYCGTGFYTRAGSEDCWLGLRGSMPTPRRDVYEEIEAPVREHSRKPDEARARLEALWPQAEGRRVELFCRGKPSPGWDGWGNECVGGLVLPGWGERAPVAATDEPVTAELFVEG